MKRGIACTYERTLPGNSRDSASASGDGRGSVPLVDAEMTEGIMADVETDRNAENDACCARTCLKSILKAVSVPAFKSLVCDTPPSSDELKAWMAASIQQYFGNFHERWTIVHAASFDERTDDAFVVGTVLMIGAWQRDRENLGELIIDIHGRLLHRLLSLLVSCILLNHIVSFILTYNYRALQAGTLAKINHGHSRYIKHVYFRSYLHSKQGYAFFSSVSTCTFSSSQTSTDTGLSQIPRVIQRSRQLLSLLIVTLREQGIFNPQFVSEHQTKHFPGDFKPWVFYFREKWKL